MENLIPRQTAEKLTELRRKYFPPKLEFYLLLLMVVIVVGIGLHQVFARNVDLAYVLIGAIVAGLLVVLGGTRACLVLYFTTNLGAAFTIPGIPVSINQAFAALFFFAVILDFYRYRTRFRLSVPIFLFIIFNVYYIAVTFATTRPEWGYPVNTIFYLIPVFTIVCLYWRESWLKYLLHSFAFVSFVLIVLPGLFEIATGMDIRPNMTITELERINGLAKDSIVYAYTAIWVVPLAALFFVESKDPLVKMYYFFMLMSLVAIAILTQNRQTPIIMGGVLVVFLFLVRYRKKMILISVFVIGVLVVSPFALGQVIERFGQTTNWKTDYSLMYRRDKIVIAQEMWKEHFWFGIGLDHYQHLWKEYAPPRKLILLDVVEHRPQYIDSGYVHLMTEFGIIGFALFFLLIAAIVAQMIRLYILSRRFEETFYTNLIAALFAMLAQLMVAMLISDASVRLQTFYMLAFLFALQTIIEDKIREKSAEGKNILKSSTEPATAQ